MAAIAHSFTEQTTRQTRTGATTYADVAGAEIADTFFVAGQKYLIIVMAAMDHSATAANTGGAGRVAHGTTSFADSEHEYEPATSTNRVQFFWFHVWTAVSGEKIVFQQRTQNAANTSGADQIVLFAMRLDADLTENTDWFFNEVATDTDLTATFATGASVTWTPGTANDIWLLLHHAQHDPAAVTIQHESRGDLSGGTTATRGLISTEPEDATNDIMAFGFGSAISLPASSHTWAEQSREEVDSGGIRLHSKVFVLNLSKFKDVSQVFASANVDLGTTAWGNLLNTLSHTKTVNGDVLVLAWGRGDHTVAGLGTTHSNRVQVDNADQPDTQTADIYGYAGPLNDATDQSLYAMATVENITANITVDHDGHGSSTAMDYKDRALICFSMELAAAPAAANPVFEMCVPEFA